MLIKNFILKRGNKEFGSLSFEDFNAVCLCLAMMTFPKGGVLFRFVYILYFCKMPIKNLSLGDVSRYVPNMYMYI